MNDRQKQIKVYAEHYHNPISDLRGFNKVIKEQIGFTTTRKELSIILGYIPIEDKKYYNKNIINNIKEILEKKDINLLNKKTYDFLNCYMGFIAHYDINGFKHYYSDLRLFSNALMGCKGLDNVGDINLYDMVRDILKVVETNKSDIINYFSDLERQEDINTIKVLMNKHKLTEVKKGYTPIPLN